MLAFRYVWESKADGAFAISEDTWNEQLGRGTEVRLHLREEAGEYVEESKLKVGKRILPLVIYEWLLYWSVELKNLILLSSKHLSYTRNAAPYALHCACTTSAAITRGHSSNF